MNCVLVSHTVYSKYKYNNITLINLTANGAAGIPTVVGNIYSIYLLQIYEPNQPAVNLTFLSI
jgi:hypothetical protein